MLTFNSDRNWFYLAPKNTVEISMLEVAENSHTSGEECNVPQVCESNSHGGVDAEDFDGWEVAVDAHQE